MSLQKGDHSPKSPQQEECLLRHQNFVAKSRSASFEPGVLDWEASTLPLSYTRKIRS
jgi:hypothetical protein